MWYCGIFKGFSFRSKRIGRKTDRPRIFIGQRPENWVAGFRVTWPGIQGWFTAVSGLLLDPAAHGAPEARPDSDEPAVDTVLRLGNCCASRFDAVGDGWVGEPVRTKSSLLVTPLFWLACAMYVCAVFIPEDTRHWLD